MNTKPQNKAIYHLKYTNNQRYIEIYPGVFSCKTQEFTRCSYVFIPLIGRALLSC